MAIENENEWNENKSKTFQIPENHFCQADPSNPVNWNKKEHKNEKQKNEKRNKKKCNCTLDAFFLLFLLLLLLFDNSAKKARHNQKNTKLLINRLLQFICKVDFKYGTKCFVAVVVVEFGETVERNETQQRIIMHKSLLTGGPVSPGSPFFPFLPRLPGGPGGPMYATERRRRGQRERKREKTHKLLHYR